MLLEKLLELWIVGDDIDDFGVVLSRLGSSVLVGSGKLWETRGDLHLDDDLCLCDTLDNVANLEQGLIGNFLQSLCKSVDEVLLGASLAETTALCRSIFGLLRDLLVGIAVDVCRVGTDKILVDELANGIVGSDGGVFDLIWLALVSSDGGGILGAQQGILEVSLVVRQVRAATEIVELNALGILEEDASTRKSEQDEKEHTLYAELLSPPRAR